MAPLQGLGLIFACVHRALPYAGGWRPCRAWWVIFARVHRALLYAGGWRPYRALGYLLPVFIGRCPMLGDGAPAGLGAV